MIRGWPGLSLFQQSTLEGAASKLSPFDFAQGRLSRKGREKWGTPATRIYFGAFLILNQLSVESSPPTKSNR
jgi:hypothetical protein